MTPRNQLHTDFKWKFYFPPPLQYLFPFPSSSSSTHNCVCYGYLTAGTRYISSFFPHSFDEVQWKFKSVKVSVQLKTFSPHMEMSVPWAPKNVVDFKCTNQNVRTFYFSLKSVNQVFAFLTSVTTWWSQTCYAIKHLENDIKTLNICEYSVKICPQIISSTPYLGVNPFSWDYERDLII